MLAGYVGVTLDDYRVLYRGMEVGYLIDEGTQLHN